MYHIEFRQFPHNTCHFNLTDPELGAIVLPWASKEWIEVGERKWNPHVAKLTIIQGPELPLDQLTMGRGWRHAEREGQDVTERVIGEAETYLATAADQERSQAPAAAEPAVPAPAPNAPARTPASPPQPGQPGSSTSGEQQAPDAHMALLADSIGLELLGLIDSGPVPLSQVLLLAQERLAGQPASESLALAELAVSSLLARRLIVLQRNDAPAGADSAPEGVEVLREEEVEPALRAIQSWSGQGQAGVVHVRRA